MAQQRKDKRAVIKKRLLEVMRTGQCSANVLAERFGLHPVYVKKVARKEGIKLPKSE